MFETDPGHLNRCLRTTDYERSPDWGWDTVIEKEPAQ